MAVEETMEESMQEPMQEPRQEPMQEPREDATLALVVPKPPLIPLPAPHGAAGVRAATRSDLAFIDGLQKKHTHMVGWMPTAQLEGKIRLGHVLVAEEAGASGGASGGPVGYCIGNDQYFKRDDLGIIYQVNVAPGKRRGLIGAALVQALFARAAYGCRLFCCWCAQDIEANYFWESLGFVPLAFRAGSRGKQRIHIFWQRRVRAGDTTTPYWFPSQTNSGSLREDRLVLPIPPDTHWRDAKPMVLPGIDPTLAALENESEARPPRGVRTKRVKTPVIEQKVIKGGGLRIAAPTPAGEAAPAAPVKRERRPKLKNDPKLVAAARELRDRWLEQVNTSGFESERILPSRGKYDVSPPLPPEGAEAMEVTQSPEAGASKVRLLEAA